MKKLFFISLILLFATPTYAIENYVSLFGNMSEMIDNTESKDLSFIDKKVKNKMGWGGSIEAGQTFGKNLRFGLQYGFQQMRIQNKVKTYKPSLTNGNIGHLSPHWYYPKRDGSPTTQPDPRDKNNYHNERGLIFKIENSGNKELKHRSTTPTEIWDRRNVVGTLSARVVDNKNGTWTYTKKFVGHYDGKNGERIAWTDVYERNTWRVAGNKNKDSISNFSNEDTLKVQTLIPNIYWDWHLGNWSPYVGAGAGMAYISQGKDYNFAWQVMAGLGYFLTDNWKASLGATFLDVGEVQFEQGDFDIQGTMQTVQMNAGLTYLF